MAIWVSDGLKTPAGIFERLLMLRGEQTVVKLLEPPGMWNYYAGQGTAPGLFAYIQLLAPHPNFHLL